MNNYGKKKCEVLKEIRQKIADANGIKYTPNECHHEGECAGTCPQCEAEVKYIESELEKKNKMNGFKKAASIVAVGSALSFGSLLSSCNSFTPGPNAGSVPREVSDTINELEGDVCAPADTPCVSEEDSTILTPAVPEASEE